MDLTPDHAAASRVNLLLAEAQRLRAQNEQLQQAVTSHAVIDQAIGALAVLGQLPPEECWRVLRDVSQRANVKLRAVSEHVLAFAQGGDLPEAERDELRRAIARYRRLAAVTAPAEPSPTP
ncbi:ANTAR domain-containing protein [Streptomyces sp. G45]|uniref:ANTAR domain-containing protein n=1 Tax=Streptomyces sp. G45 TaxID=3406627 RepID=UPI003C26B07C